VIEMDEVIKEAHNVLDSTMKNREEMEIYEMELKADLDYNSNIYAATKKGKEESIIKGKKEGIEEGIIKGKEEGIEEGIIKGKEEGIEEGIIKGKEEGKEETIIMLAKKMKKNEKTC
jgi:flagellar biosynthesis/type III secretory pathway protein FliH